MEPLMSSCGRYIILLPQRGSTRLTRTPSALSHLLHLIIEAGLAGQGGQGVGRATLAIATKTIFSHRETCETPGPFGQLNAQCNSWSSRASPPFQAQPQSFDSHS